MRGEEAQGCAGGGQRRWLLAGHWWGTGEKAKRFSTIFWDPFLSAGETFIQRLHVDGGKELHKPYLPQVCSLIPEDMFTASPAVATEKIRHRFCISVDILLTPPPTPSLAIKGCLRCSLCPSLPLPSEDLQRLFINSIMCDQPSGFLGQEMRQWMLKGWNGTRSGSPYPQVCPVPQ